MPNNYTRGPEYKRVTVLNINYDNHLVTVRDTLKQLSQIPVDVLGYKGDYPAPGEEWLVSRSTGSWLFAHIIGYRPRPSKYTISIGDGSATSYTVNHNIGTRDVIVQVYADLSAPFGQVTPNSSGPLTAIQHTTENTVTLTFTSAPASNAYRVVILSA